MRRLHPREDLVQQAELDLMQKLIDWQRAHDLTDGELIAVLSRTLGDRLGGIAKYMIRVERHGNADRPGGLDEAERENQ